MGATIGTRLFTWLKGQHVGSDEFGNKYYLERKEPRSRRRKRWVIYNGIVEASKVPAMWHAWLHYTIDQTPDKIKMPHYDWQEAHQPNLTGTKGAYVPDGHLLRGGERAATTADYQAWQP